MKKRDRTAALGLIFALAASTVSFAGTGPAYPEVPAGERTSNLAENQEFVDWRELSVSDGETLVFYDMYGNPLRDARLAGGEITTNEDGIAIWNGITIQGNYDSVVLELLTSDYGWRQDVEKPVNESGLSNWYYKGNATMPAACGWVWLSDENNAFSTRKAYCFNEYGYLYVNTITPDGFIVNERGQMVTEDGRLVEHEVNALTHDAYRQTYASAPIGNMREEYFTTCIWPECGGRCFTGENEKEFPNRPSVVGHE